jgi:hypothetical protein
MLYVNDMAQNPEIYLVLPRKPMLYIGVIEPSVLTF